MKRSVRTRLLAALTLALLFLVPGFIFAQAPKEKDQTAILAVMQRQEDCWNTGDLSCFMNGYWRSDSLKFIGKSGITYGWDATLARYEKSYPDKAAMGTLTFTILHLEAISPKATLVIGKWHLQRKKDAPEGHFSLLWKKIKGEWVIVADHSS